MDAQVLTVSSKGQIAIPVAIRNRMSIGKGDKLIAYTSGDAIMLKTINMPTTEELSSSMSEVEKLIQAESDNGDITSTVSKRGRKKAAMRDK